MNISLSSFAPENLVSQDGFGRPVSRQPAQYRLNLVLIPEIPNEFRGDVHLFKPPYAIRLVPSLSGHAIPYRWRSPIESSVLPQDPNVKGRGNRGPPVWMQYVDPSPNSAPYTTGSCFASSGHKRKRPHHRMTSCNRALEITRCESMKTTLRTRRLLWAGALTRMSGGRLPKRIVFGNLEGTVRRGRGGKDKEWTDCVHGDIRAFGKAGDWKATALKAEVWVETVTEGGRRFMAAWRKEEVDAARHRQEKRGNETGKVVIAHGSVEFCEATPIGLVDEPKKSYTGARRTETCVAPRHVDATRHFYFLLSQRAAWGGGVRCQTFSLCPLFPVQQTTSHERCWPPCKFSFFGLATITLNVRNNHNCREFAGTRPVVLKLVPATGAAFASPCNHTG